MEKSDVYERAFIFAARVEGMADALLKAKERVSRNSINQLLRSSSAIGAHLQEAKGAQSRPDFHFKIRLALKEARESLYWLRLIEKNIARPRRLAWLLQEANEIVSILTTIAKKTNPNNPKPTS